MNADLRTKWLAALRSGEYTQGSGALRPTDTTYCCIGVLCDVYGKETGQGQWVLNERHQHRFILHPSHLPYDPEQAIVGTTAMFPRLLQERIGLTGFVEGELVLLNDREGLTFDEIANWVEAHQYMFENVTNIWNPKESQY